MISLHAAGISCAFSGDVWEYFAEYFNEKAWGFRGVFVFVVYSHRGCGQ